MRLEVGDMILWVSDFARSSADLSDTGWVVHVEKRHRKAGGDALQELVVVHWLSNNSVEEHWTEWLLNDNCTIIKGGQDDR